MDSESVHMDKNFRFCTALEGCHFQECSMLNPSGESFVYHPRGGNVSVTQSNTTNCAVRSYRSGASTGASVGLVFERNIIINCIGKSIIGLTTTECQTGAVKIQNSIVAKCASRKIEYFFECESFYAIREFTFIKTPQALTVMTKNKTPMSSDFLGCVFDMPEKKYRRSVGVKVIDCAFGKGVEAPTEVNYSDWRCKTPALRTSRPTPSPAHSADKQRVSFDLPVLEDIDFFESIKNVGRKEPVQQQEDKNMPISTSDIIQIVVLAGILSVSAALYLRAAEKKRKRIESENESLLSTENE